MTSIEMREGMLREAMALQGEASNIRLLFVLLLLDNPLFIVLLQSQGKARRASY
jgi:hypothetical protein